MEKVLEALKLLASQLPVETLVNATVDAQAGQIKLFVPPTNADGTPVNLLTKAGLREIPRSYKIVGAVIVAIVVIGVIVGIVVGMKSSSSASTNSSTGSGASNSGSSTESGLNSGSSSGSSIVVDLEPTPTPTTATVYGLQVSSIIISDDANAAGITELRGISLTSNGNIYLSDGNRVLRMTNESSSPTLYAGDLSSGNQLGNRLSARFSALGALSFVPNSDLFVCDSGNQLVRKITGDTVSNFNAAPRPSGIAVDSSGYVYFMDELNNRVFKQPPDGNPAWTFATGSSIDTPKGITIDSTDNIYITDKNRVLKFTRNECGGRIRDERIRKCGGRIRTLQHSLGADYRLGRRFTSGTIDGLILNATFENPVDIAAAADSVFYVVDGLLLRKIYTV